MRGATGPQGMTGLPGQAVSFTFFLFLLRIVIPNGPSLNCLPGWPPKYHLLIYNSGTNKSQWNNLNVDSRLSQGMPGPEGRKGEPGETGDPVRILRQFRTRISSLFAWGPCLSLRFFCRVQWDFAGCQGHLVPRGKVYVASKSGWKINCI